MTQEFSLNSYGHTSVIKYSRKADETPDVICQISFREGKNHLYNVKVFIYANKIKYVENFYYEICSL